MQNSSSLVSINTLVNFLRSESDCLKLPLLGSIKDGESKSGGKAFTKPKQTVCNTFDESIMKTSDGKVKDRKSLCPCCSKTNHDLNDCKFFLQKPMEEKVEFIEAKKLCFGCLKYSNHRSRDSKIRLVCDICGDPHPSSLHKAPMVRRRPTVNYEGLEASSNPREQAFRASSSQSGRVVCPGIPVGIKINGTNEILVTNMALDTYATACYMVESLLESLNFIGLESSLTLTTMESSSAAVKVTEELQIQSLDGEVSVTVPKLFAKSCWPFEDADSPTIDDIKGFPALQRLPLHFRPQKIGLLIGMNVPEIIRPLAVVNTTDGGPYATKHLLGWAINGPIRELKESSYLCFRTMVRDEVLEEKIYAYFSRDFVDKYDEPVDSLQDTRWKDIVTEGIKKLPNSSYEIPLPFKNTNVNMPNNFGYVVARLNSLRRQLKADEGLMKEYSSFMDEMFHRGFAEEVPATELMCPDGKVWFLPHHGVRHKRKNKLRIVYDCSSKFR